MQFSPYSSPIRLACVVKFHPAMLTSGGVKQWTGGKTSHFLAFNVNISKTLGDTTMTNRKLYMHFRLTL